MIPFFGVHFMLRYNKLTLLAVSALSCLTACNNVGDSGSTSTTSTVNSSQAPNVSQKMFGPKTHNNELHFKSHDSLMNIKFTLTDHHITEDQPFDETIGQIDDGIMVKAGRKEDKSNTTDLISKNFAGANDQQEYLDKNIYFVIYGTFSFYQKTNNTNYDCKNVAIAQYQSDIAGSALWAFFSNRAPGLAALADKSNSVNIDCTNTTTKDVEVFTITGTTTHDQFRIEPTTYSSKDIGVVLNGYTFGQALTDAYNSMPGTTQLSLFSNNAYGLSGRNLEVFNPRVATISYSAESSEQVGDAVVTDYSLLDISTTTLKNTSDIQQTMQSSSYSKTVTNGSTSTITNGWEVGGEVAIASPVLIKLIVGGLNIKINAKYNGNYQSSTTNSETVTYTAPSQNILIPPHSAAKILVTFGMATYSAKFNFSEQAKGVAYVDGVVFNDSNEVLPHIMNGNHYGSVDIYSVFANATSWNNPQIKLSPKDPITGTGSILFTGLGTVSGVSGTGFNVSIEIVALDAQNNLTNKVTDKYDLTVPTSAVPDGDPVVTETQK